MKEHKTEIDNFFVAIGLSFPSSEEGLRCFEDMYRNASFKFDENSISPERIANQIRKPVKITHVEYHKRTVLAAEIVYQLKDEWTLGRVKLQKLLYLCQNVAKMPVYMNFLRQAMGPYDPRLMRSLESQFLEHKWFEFINQNSSLKYRPLANVGGHKEWFDRYHSKYADRIAFLIETFRKTKTSEVELIATIHACWVEALNNKEIFCDNLIIKKVYEWSPDKAKFSEPDIVNAIKKMIELSIYPTTENLN